MNPKAKTALILLATVGLFTGVALVLGHEAKAAEPDDDAVPPVEGDAAAPIAEGEAITVQDPQGNVTEVDAASVTSAPQTSTSTASAPVPAPVASAPQPNVSPAPVQSAPSAGPTSDLVRLAAECKAQGGTFDLKTRQCILPGGGITTSTASPQTSSAPANMPTATSVPSPADQAEHPAVLETAPALDPNGTIALDHLLLAAENEPNWKTALAPEIEAWQRAVGSLLPDRKFGPKSAYRMAEEVGVLPYIRFWPLGAEWGGGNKAKALAKYRKELNAIADRLAKSPEKQAQAAALRASALRETGQGWPEKPAAQPQSVREVQTLVDRLGAESAAKAVTGLINKVS